MRRKIGHKSHSFAPTLRGLLTALLTVAYVVVGIAGEISCARETLENAGQLELDGAPGKTDPGANKSAGVVDHCYTCVPLVIPAPVVVAEPSARTAGPTFATPTFLLEDHPGLDTPPPKRLA
jgi:hypothetical protein